MNDIDAIRGYKPPSEGGTFLKLADGETAKVRITSLPVIFQNEFRMGDESTLSTRFAFIIWNHDTSQAQIWQTNGATYGQQIAPLLEDDEYGDWREYDVKVSRTGEKAQTRYNVRPGTKRYELTSEQLSNCQKLDIIGMLKKSDSISQVYWLAEWRELEKKSKSPQPEEHTPGVIDQTSQYTAPEDEPINLDDIPF